MRRLLLHTEALVSATAGRLIAGSHRALTGVCIDTRAVQPGQVFFCIRGPRFDGHAFAWGAVNAGAVAVVADARGVVGLEPGTLGRQASVVVVADVPTALGRFARAHRARFSHPVVALTGSSGKTTTKEMIAAVLATRGPVLATRGNENNHLGVPLTLLKLSGKHGAAVVEMGMSAPGEIASLARIARPDVGVVTTVGAAHLEGLGSVAEVARAKGELFAALPHSGLAIMNSDVAWPWILTSGLRAPLALVGERAVDEVRLLGAREAARGATGILAVEGARYPLRLRMAGRHNLRNAALAVAVGRALGVPVAEATEALAGVPAPALRGELRRLPGGGEVVLDCYNANPQSVAAALRTFARRAPKGLVVLGSMLELGEGAAQAHREVGALVASLPGSLHLIAVGELAASMVDGARAAGLERGRTEWVSDVEAAAEAVRAAWAGVRRPVLLKASRGARLERVWDALVEMEGV